MPKLNFGATKVMGSKIPDVVKSKSPWGSHFDRDSGFAFKLPHDNTASIFVDRRLTTGDPKQVAEVFRQGGIAARIITCEGHEWRATLEPIDRRKWGITVLTNEDKVVMSGQARVSANGEVSFSVRTIYPKISASPKKTTASAGGSYDSKGEWKVEGKVGVEW